MIDDIIKRIHEEVLITQYNTGETDLTIFLSPDLFYCVHAYVERFMLYTTNSEQTRLFGCKVEKYIDNGCSFYVAAAKKISF